MIINDELRAYALEVSKKQLRELRKTHGIKYTVDDDSLKKARAKSNVQAQQFRKQMAHEEKTKRAVQKNS